MTVLTPWREVPRPADAAHVAGCWSMAAIGAEQHPLNVRMLWNTSDDLSAGEELLAIGGLVEFDRDAMAFAWARDGLPLLSWRRILQALRIGIATAHERSIRRIFAIVEAAHVQAIRLIKALGFEFANNETGWPNTDAPMLRYVHARPAIDEPALVRHQRREYELACLGAWCPEIVRKGHGAEGVL
jgi:hypothetical protein